MAMTRGLNDGLPAASLVVEKADNGCATTVRRKSRQRSVRVPQAGTEISPIHPKCICTRLEPDASRCPRSDRPCFCRYTTIHLVVPATLSGAQACARSRSPSAWAEDPASHRDRPWDTGNRSAPWAAPPAHRGSCRTPPLPHRPGTMTPAPPTPPETGAAIVLAGKTRSRSGGTLSSAAAFRDQNARVVGNNRYHPGHSSPVPPSQAFPGPLRAGRPPRPHAIGGSLPSHGKACPE